MLLLIAENKNKTKWKWVCVCPFEETHKTAPMTVYNPSSFVGWPQRMWWERPLTERLFRDKECKSEQEKMEGVKRPKGRKKRIEREGDGGQRASWCESASDHLVLLLRPLALSLSICSTLSFFLSFPLEFLSQRFTTTWRWVVIDDNNRDASVKAHTRTRTHIHTPGRWMCTQVKSARWKLKVALKRAHSHTHGWTHFQHRAGLWVKAAHKA